MNSCQTNSYVLKGSKWMEYRIQAKASDWLVDLGRTTFSEELLFGYKPQNERFSLCSNSLDHMLLIHPRDERNFYMESCKAVPIVTKRPGLMVLGFCIHK